MFLTLDHKKSPRRTFDSCPRPLGHHTSLTVHLSSTSLTVFLTIPCKRSSVGSDIEVCNVKQVRKSSKESVGIQELPWVNPHLLLWQIYWPKYALVEILIEDCNCIHLERLIYGSWTVEELVHFEVPKSWQVKLMFTEPFNPVTWDWIGLSCKPKGLACKINAFTHIPLDLRGNSRNRLAGATHVILNPAYFSR